MTTGSLRAQFDQHGKIDILDLQIEKHTEYVPRNKIQSPLESPEQKPSPSLTKNAGKRGIQQRNNKQLPVPDQPPPVMAPRTIINDYGITQPVSAFLEVSNLLSISEYYS